MSLNVKMIRDSFELAKPIADKIADRFYVNLWGDYPSSKVLFEGVDMAKQKSALVGSLVQVVDNLDQPAKLTTFLKALGGRHNKYGTEEVHYEWVGASLLKTFGEFFGEAWTPALKEQWTEAYQFIAETMRSGAAVGKPKADIQGGLASFKVDPSKIGSEGAVDLELTTAFKSKIRETVQRLVEQHIEAEIQSALQHAEKHFDSQIQGSLTLKRKAS